MQNETNASARYNLVKRLSPLFVQVFILLFASLPGAICAGATPVLLPGNVRAVWDLDRAHRETTPTRQRISLNGLWQWQPADGQSGQVPGSDWGFFKVPGSWPGITDYMQKDSQTLFAHPKWDKQPVSSVTAAWYQREFTVPSGWSGRRISARIEYLNSYAAVYVDGREIGELRFPGGEIDLSSACLPGRTHQLRLLVVAMPLKGVMTSYTDSASAREVKGSVRRRGLCGDVYLVGAPSGPRIGDVKIDTSTRKGEITFSAALEALAPASSYALRARITENGRTVADFRTPGFRSANAGRVAHTEKWMPEKLWDIHTPQNMHELELSLLEASGDLLDTSLPVRFGFREFWIEGRDFYLNGTRIFLSSVPLDNAQVGAALANYEAARESLERLQSFGINFVYTHNYDCKPGSHLGFREILRAADDTGMLVSFSQPHFSDYDWASAEADRTNGYAGHAEFYVQAAQNHASVVAYSMSHNATGYSEDMNPHMIDGVQDRRDSWSLRNSKLALRAEAIVKNFDPGRVVYHHASGNLGSLHAINFYPNFVPVQEMSDWFEHWATRGVKPVFTCEFAAPFSWDWTMYRGWHNGQREFGSAKVPWEFCIAEWNAQFFGDTAFKISDQEKANLRWEAKQFRAGKLWHRWDYPHQVGSSVFEERYPVFENYITDNWRAFRTWGVSATSPWEHGHYWKLPKGMDKRRQDFEVDWDNLQRPGFSPDFADQRYERMDLAFERSDWVPTAAAQALIRNNRPLLGFIAGKPSRFTSKDHIFSPGETVEKQAIVLNNSRQSIVCSVEWQLNLPRPIAGRTRVAVRTGQQERIALRFDLPQLLPSGKYELSATFKFDSGETQQDSFCLNVIAEGVAPAGAFAAAKVALFDPAGETAALLSRLGIVSQGVDAGADLAAHDVLIVGKAALTLDGPAPDISRVREGLKVLIFEQTSEVLEKRFGFRVQEYGLRQAFPRVPDHPTIANLKTEHLRDWRGEATLLPPQLEYELRPRHGPTVQWCGIPVPRLWRCGNRGNVASVLIEKPAKGDFLPIIDGGYSLQYTPLMEYREGKGLVVFCQMDVTARTESDPAAEIMTRNLLAYLFGWKPGERRTAVYAGDPAGLKHLQSAGLPVISYEGGRLSTGQVLVVGSRAEGLQDSPNIREFLGKGGKLLGIGLDQPSASALVPFPVKMKKAEHISAWFEAPGMDSPLAGAGPADVHNRDPRELPLVTSGMAPAGNGVLAVSPGGNVIFCQLEPWSFEGGGQLNLKRTHRRASFLLSRLLANLGVAGPTPVLDRFSLPVDNSKPEKRWLSGHYFDEPEEWDDPYRFFRW
jgi:beta-galactosidase